MDYGLSRRRRIYLMRHGEVEYFDRSGKPFRPDEVPLTDRGRQQATKAAEILRDVALDRVLASPLLRTVQTAELVLAGRHVPIEQHEAIREIAPGRLRELSIDPETLRRSFLGAFGLELSPSDRFLGGETFEAMLARVLGFFRDLLRNPDWNDVLIVAHGGVNRAILTEALGTGLSGFGRLEQDPACINILDVDEERRVLVRMINFSPTNPAKLGHRFTTMEDLMLRYLGQDPDDLGLAGPGTSSEL